MQRTAGFSLIELLIVMGIIGVLAAMLIPNLLQARRTATERAALAYAANVYKVAFAYVATEGDGSVLVGDCSDGYTAGSFSIPDPGNGYVNSCSVAAIPSGPGISVTSVYGTVQTVP